MEAVDDLRTVAAIAAAYCITWSWRGVWDFFRGRFWPPSYYLVVTFWFALAVVNFQVSYWLGQPPAWRILSFVFLITGLVVAAIGQRLGYTSRARVLYGMVEHLADAKAIADLAAVDPAAATRLAEEARRLTAAALVSRLG